MDKANIVITGVAISPNPVTVNKSYIISVEIQDAVWVLGDDTGVIVDSDAAMILVPDYEIKAMADGDGAVIVDIDGSIMEDI